MVPKWDGPHLQRLRWEWDVKQSTCAALAHHRLRRPRSPSIPPATEQVRRRPAASAASILVSSHRRLRRSPSIPPASRAGAVVPPAASAASILVTVKMEGNARGSGHSEALKNYNLGRTLGIGSFGKVKIAEHKLTGHRVAIKILNRRQMRNMEMEEKAKREIKILRLFIHPHIIRLYEEDEARRIFQQIISGVEYCHRNMVVHRDLKPENLLLDSKYNVKLADFGLSNVMHDGHFLKTSCGSPNYAAPEVISGKLYAGPEVDVWSCGVILYALLCGTLPFDDENIPNLFKKIKGGIYTLPSHLSALARDLIPRMLVVDPMKRITIREIREHQWFQIRLPRYLAVPPPDTAQQAKMIDEDTLQDVVNLGYEKDHVCESLRNRLQNEATVAYYLLLDNRFRATSGYLGADYQESLERNLNRFAASESASSNTRHYLPGSSDPHASGLRPHYPVERKWALGLQSRAQPREIMIEVLKALEDLNVCWKKNGQYNMKCRWSVGYPQATDMLDVNHSFVDDSIIMDNGDVNGRLPAVIKFEIQLYKSRDEKYLLDMQRVTGPQLLFLDFCAAFLTKLRVL
uniref:non-specific serine/threonine protein kinase n=1 Tax=Oryza meridionalis TaxID=40149 RepID=A0A0E0EMG8_9ORYZ